MMDTDDLYKTLSARLTAGVLGSEQKPAGYFDELRTVVRRVVIETDESGLSADEKNGLSERLQEHVSMLETFLPRLKPSNVPSPDDASAEPQEE
jgi:hypothetical protein